MSAGSRTWNGVPWPDGSVATRIALLDGPAPARFAAFASLADDETPEVERAFVLRLGTPDWRTRRAACEALGARARARASLDAIAARLDDSSSYVVAAACRALGRLGAVHLRRELARLLARPDDGIRLAAVDALDACGGAEAFEDLLRVATYDASESVRRRAAFAVHDHASAATWAALLERWRADALPRHRAWACDLAGRFGDAACVPALHVLEADRDGHVRRAARSALATITERAG